MVKSYDRWGPTQAFGIVCSAGANSVYDGKLAYVPALEDVLVWDVKKGQMLAMWHETGHRAEVTCIQQSPQADIFGVGYADGSVRLWSASSGTVSVVFNSHKKAVTALTFDSTGSRLVSGSQDTDLILWDVVGETGIVRLRGHRDQITGIRFLDITSTHLPSTSSGKSTSFGYLVTCSKDTFLKVWDLSTAHCVQTIVAHHSEIWSLDLSLNSNIIFTGSGEGEVKAWKLDFEALESGMRETEQGELTKMVHPLANLPIASRHKVSQIAIHPSHPFLAVQSHDRSVEIFRIRTEEEVRKKQARRLKRAKKKEETMKSKADDQMDEERADDQIQDLVKEVQLVDLYTPYTIVRAGCKIRSFDFVKDDSSTGHVQIFTATSANSAEVFTIPLHTKSKDVPEPIRIHSLDLPGHRTDIRTVSISADDQLLATASNGGLKIWNLKTLACIRTLECGHAICSSFLPGDRHVVVGTKSGDLLLYNVASAELIDTTKAHSSTIWSLHVRPDFGGLVTGSADKDIKFWDIKEVKDSEEKRKRLSLVHVKTLKMTDEVLAVRYSPNNRFLAVALLDATVKVFYQDTLKFFLSLYGHKLPVLSLDISSDSKLIITSSADKNVKIWGLDFGDCHKSIFAHDDSVMQVAFEPQTHNFFSVSKDKYVKYWDGDKFELIQKMDGHHSEIWALAASRHGGFIVTGSHDKSIRVWEKTDEPLFLEEEREKELEKLYEGGIADTLNREDAPFGSGADGSNVDGTVGPEAIVVQKHTTETLMAGERIMEALELADGERDAMRRYREVVHRLPENEKAKVAPPPPNAVLTALQLTPEAYVLRTVERIPTAALYDALLVLSFTRVSSLFHYMDMWASQDISTTLTSHILTYLLRTHASQIVATRSLRPILLSLRGHLRAALLRQKSQIGYNLAALKIIRRQDEEARTAELYEQGEKEGWAEDEIAKVKEKLQSGEMGHRKRKRVTIK